MTPVLIAHVAAGAVALPSGFAALALRKGEGAHRAAGTVFFAAMLVMSGLGACVAALEPNRPTVFIGMLTFYLVATAWAAVRRQDGRIGIFEIGALLLVLGVATALAALGWEGAHSPRGQIDGLPFQPVAVFGAVAVLAAGFDLRGIWRGGVSGPPRIARHLWRMCMALTIAASSFFLGQQQVMPQIMRGSPLLVIPPVATLGVMVVWLVRVRLGHAFEPKAATSTVERLAAPIGGR